VPLVVPPPIPLASSSAPGWTGWWTPSERADRALDAIRHETHGEPTEYRPATWAEPPPAAAPPSAAPSATAPPAVAPSPAHPVPYPRSDPARTQAADAAPNRDEGRPPEQPAKNGSDNGEPRLNRRKPQTHLAPELRLPTEMAEPPARPPSSAHALTSYQANRNAAAAAWTDPPDAR